MTLSPKPGPESSAFACSYSMVQSQFFIPSVQDSLSRFRGMAWGW